MTLDFDPDEIRRYSRHILLAEVGGTGQARLRDARVLIIGAGGLGSPLLLYLAAAGVGTIGLVDDDVLELSNLQRQIAHTTTGIGRPKVENAAAAALAINPLIKIEPHRHRLDATNALDLIAKYDLVCDGSDNFPTRFLVADAASSPAAPSSPPPSSASRASSRSSSPTPAPTTPATAASTPNPRPKAWSPAAAKPASSAPSPASWAPCRPPKC